MEVEKFIKIQQDTEQKIDKAISNFKKTPKARITVAHLETRLELLNSYWKTFDSTHELILTECPEDDNCYFTSDTYYRVEEKYIEYKSDLKETLSKIQTLPSPVTKSTESHVSEASNAVKLPKIILPVFSGLYLEWPTFHDLFESLIHENQSLPAVQKLHYLKSHLSGEAEQLLRHIPITEANYEQCWTQLKKRYGNKRYLSSCILNRLINQKGLTSESSNGVKQLLDTTNECLSALTNMGIDISTWDIFIIHLVTQKLDQESRKLWEQKISDNSDQLPTFSEFSMFLESRFRALEFCEPSAKKDLRLKESIERPKVFSITSSTASVSCLFCPEAHLLFQCKKFIQESTQKRRDFIKDKQLCFNCFGAKHSANQCRRYTSCKRCGQRHHTLLHLDSNYPPSEQPDQPSPSNVIHGRQQEEVQDQPAHVEAEPASVVSHFTEGSVMSASEVILATALVKVENKNNCQVFRALLDQGSQASFVSEYAVQLLHLHKLPVKGNVSGLGGKESCLPIKYMVRFKIQSNCSSYSCVVQAYVLNRLTSTLPSQNIVIQDFPELKHLELADPSYNTPGGVDILLGADIYGQILTDGIVRSSSGTLTAQNTLLGWILSGRVQVSNDCDNFITTHILDNSLNDTLLKFWEIETDQPRTLLSKEDQKCENHFLSTTTRDSTGRYVVSLPFRDDNPMCQYGESRKVALRRFHSMEKRLDSNPLLKQEYSKVMNEYLSLNHMELIQDQQEISKPGCVYLPHHAVVRDDKSTSKVRIVFDGSSKGVNGSSLNDDLLVGPRLQPELRHIILKWRLHPICLVADIIKMYRQVKVVDKDTDFLRLLWRENSNESIKEYRMLRVTFGVSSAPYLAVKSLQQVAKDDGKDYPLAADRVLTDFYMDDFMSGCETDDEALQIYSEMVSLLAKAGFELQKWTSNSQKMMEIMHSKPATSNDKSIKLDDIIKILGLSWNHQTDSFHYKVNLPVQQTPVTKRTILSDISRLFDPLGWIAPVIIRAKIFMQRLWLSGLSWDEEVSSDLLDEWNEFREQLPILNQFLVPRWIGVKKDVQDIQLHGYCDASNDAYAAVVYIRVVDHEASTNLVGKFTQSVRRIVQDVKDEGASSGQTKEEVIETNERLRMVRIRLDENYDTAKKALVTLMTRYNESKAQRNLFTRYAMLKVMIKDVIRLETQYWSLVEIPRQEKAETVPAFVLRACAIMEKTQKSGEGVKTSSKLAEEAADRRDRIERLSDMTTSQIEAENTQMTNDLYRLLKKYTGLRNLIRELKSEYVSTKVYPMFPRYTMLKDMIKDIMHDPDYMEVCHEIDP